MKNIYARVGGVNSKTVLSHLDVNTIYKVIKTKFYGDIEKLNRDLVYPTFSNSRPNKDSFDDWSGLQIFDLDIHSNDIATTIIKPLYDILCRFKWFSFITLSTGNGGIHIHTAIDVNDEQDKKSTYCYSYYWKCKVIKAAIDSVCEKYNIKHDGFGWIDNHMLNVAQGVFFPATEYAYFNDNFEMLKFDGEYVIDSDVCGLKKRIDSILNANDKNEISVDQCGDIPTDLKEPKHYKYNERYSIINTLVALYGVEKTKELLPYIFTKTPTGELLAIIRTASSNKKSVSELGVKLLNENHGFNIKYTIEHTQDIDIEDFDDGVIVVDKYISESDTLQQYDWRGMNMLIAPTGTGKTSFFETLSQNCDFDKVIIVQPMQASVMDKCQSLMDKGINFGLLIEKSVIKNKELMAKRNNDAKLIYAVYDSFMLKGDKHITDNTLVVIDEIHNIFELTDWRSKMYGLVEYIKTLNNVVIMTGTPTIERYIFKGIDNVFKIKSKTYINRHFHLLNINSFTNGKVEKGATNEQISDIVRDIVNKEQPDKIIIYSDSKQILMLAQQTLSDYDLKMIYSDLIKSNGVDGDIDKIDGFCATCAMKEGFDYKSKTKQQYKVVCIAIDNSKTQSFIPTIIQIGERIRNPKSLDTYYISRKSYHQTKKYQTDENLLESMKYAIDICNLFRHKLNHRDVKLIDDIKCDVYNTEFLETYINYIGYTFDTNTLERCVDTVKYESTLLDLEPRQLYDTKTTYMWTQNNN